MQLPPTPSRARMPLPVQASTALTLLVTAQTTTIAVSPTRAPCGLPKH